MKTLLFSINYDLSRAKKIAGKAGLKLGKCKISRFADREISVLLGENVENAKVYVLGSTPPPSDNIMELLILIHTLKANGASEVHAIIPYLGYAKADHVYPPGATLSAKLVAEMIEIAGANSVSVINAHSDLALNFFNVPVKNLDAISVMAKHIKAKKLDDFVIVSPDFGGVERAKAFNKESGNGKDIVIVRKYRPQIDKVKAIEVIGDVAGRNVVIVDDLLQSGGTMIAAAKILKKKGAKDVSIATVHLVFTGPSVELLAKDKNIKKVFYTDTILPEGKLPSKFEKISLSTLIANSLE